MELSSVAGEDGWQYAGFWRRFGAFWIDLLFLLPLIGLSLSLARQIRLFHVYWLIPGLLIGLGFHVYLVGRYGGTPGKLALKIRIAMKDGAPVTFRAAALRYSVDFVLALLISVAYASAALSISDARFFSVAPARRDRALLALVPPWFKTVRTLIQIWIWSEFVTMLFNRKRRAVHDFLAGTVVVRVQPDSERVQPPSTLPA